MTMAVREGYVNPLTMMGRNKSMAAATSPFTQQRKGERNEAQDLQTRRQTLQNQLLLLKSTTDGAMGTAELQEELQKKLEEISAELKTTKAQEAQTAQPVREKDGRPEQPESVRMYSDRYDRNPEQTESPGLYRIQKDRENSYTILFSPFKERQ